MKRLQRRAMRARKTSPNETGEELGVFNFS